MKPDMPDKSASRQPKRYYVWKTQIISEYQGVLEHDGNFHQARIAGEKLFEVGKSVIHLCDECKKQAVSAGFPKIYLIPIEENTPEKRTADEQESEADNG